MNLLLQQSLSADESWNGSGRVYGEQELAGLESKHIRKIISGDRPNVARAFIKAFRQVCILAVEHGSITSDPTATIKIAPPKSDGHRTWTEDEIAIFEGHWPIGSKERLAFALLLFAGLRRGDAIRLKPEQFKNGVLTARQSKTGATVVPKRDL
jgi:integrase